MFADVSHAFTPNEDHPYVFVGEYEIGPDAREWCVEELGEPGPRWMFHRDHIVGSFTYFRDKIDATAFKMRWC